MENYVIKVNNVSKSFKIGKPRGVTKFIENTISQKDQKTFLAVDSVSFSAKKGEVLGIIGLNGSGKTTLLRLIAGVYQPDSGSIEIDGKISPLMQLGAGFQGDLDCRDNIVVNGLLLGMQKSEILGKIDSIIQYAELEKFQGQKLKHLSSGMRARLAFGAALQMKSQIFLIDEILSVGDKDFQKKSYDSMLSLKNEGKTILHATHNLNRLVEFSDKILLIDQGKIISIGDPNTILEKYKKLRSSN